VLGYQMLTGRVPFEAGNSMALLLKHVTERPTPIAELRPDTPRGLRETIERAMMKAPQDRWPAAAALREALLSPEPLGPVWRGEQRAPVKYVSPRPDGSRKVAAVRAPSKPTKPVLAEPPHLASLTPEQRKDLRLWHGRVTYPERIKAIRGYAFLTLAATVGGIMGFVFGVTEAPPLVLAPIVPLYMSRKLWLRRQSLREAGFRLRQLLPAPHITIRRKRPVLEEQLEKLAPAEVLESPEGAAIRRAVEDRAAIFQIFEKLPKVDRASLPDLVSTVKLLVERVAHLAQALHRLDQSIDPALGHELDGRITRTERETPSPEADRQLSLLRRQRLTLDELVQRRSMLARQLESAGLALGSLRLDLIKVRSSGLQSALSDVSSATQEARALSNDIDAVLAAAAEMKNL
jgi:serine/threonine-protein kinase